MQHFGDAEYIIPVRRCDIAVFGDICVYPPLGLGQLGHHTICCGRAGAGRYVGSYIGSEFKLGGDRCGRAAADVGRRHYLKA